MTFYTVCAAADYNWTFRYDGCDEATALEKLAFAREMLSTRRLVNSACAVRCAPALRTLNRLSDQRSS